MVEGNTNKEMEERLRLMRTYPQTRKRGQVSKEDVAIALQYQKEFIHRSASFSTSAILDCEDSLEQLRNARREARECREMMWGDYYAAKLNSELAQAEASKAKKLIQETAMLAQIQAVKDKLNMAIELRLVQYIESTMHNLHPSDRKAYFLGFNNSGQTPLHRACKTNDVHVVRSLLAFGADLNVIDEAGKSVFHLLADNNYADLFHTLMAQLTIETEDILIQTDKAGHSLLHATCAAGGDSILITLMNGTCSHKIQELVNLPTINDQHTALHLAALRGHTNCVRILLQVNGVQCDLRNRKGSTALHLALQQTFNIEALVGAFLELVPRDSEQVFNIIDEETGQHCLHTAVLKNFRGVSIALIHKPGMQLNVATRDGGWSPLHLAIMTEEVEIVKALIAAGAMLDLVDNDGQTPLLQACLGDKIEMVRLLLDAGANPTHLNKQAHSPLHYLSAFCRDRQLLIDILNRGADVNAKSLKLNTPMHFAAMNGNEVATEVLLAHGASASAINEDKRSVVYLAKKWRHQLVEDLVKPPDEAVDNHPRFGSASHHRSGTPFNNQTSQHQQLSNKATHLTHRRSLAAVHRHRPRSSTPMTTRSEESDLDSIYSFEDDEVIFLPSTPWPSVATANNNNHTSSANPKCRSIGEFRDRFMGNGVDNDYSAVYCSQKVALKPVMLVANEQRRLIEELRTTATQAARMQELPSSITTHMTKFTRKFLPGPVHIPWEMTVPVAMTQTTDFDENQHISASLQRQLKPSIRTNIGLFRDHLAHAQQLHWPQHTSTTSKRYHERISH